MPRVLALLLIPALLVPSGVGPLLHTHAYTDHDHPDHHHGPAAHDHHLTAALPAARHDEGIARIEGCDPGKHTVSFASLCGAVPPAPIVVAELGVPAVPSPDLQTWHPVGHTDVRVHGPPSRSPASPRAPPLALHA